MTRIIDRALDRFVDTIAERAPRVTTALTLIYVAVAWPMRQIDPAQLRELAGHLQAHAEIEGLQSWFDDEYHRLARRLS